MRLHWIDIDCNQSIFSHTNSAPKLGFILVKKWIFIVYLLFFIKVRHTAGSVVISGRCSQFCTFFTPSCTPSHWDISWGHSPGSGFQKPKALWTQSIYVQEALWIRARLFTPAGRGHLGPHWRGATVGKMEWCWEKSPESYRCSSVVESAPHPCTPCPQKMSKTDNNWRVCGRDLCPYHHPETSSESAEFKILRGRLTKLMGVRVGEMTVWAWVNMRSPGGTASDLEDGQLGSRPSRLECYYTQHTEKSLWYHTNWYINSIRQLRLWVA